MRRHRPRSYLVESDQSFVAARVCSPAAALRRDASRLFGPLHTRPEAVAKKHLLGNRTKDTFGCATADLHNDRRDAVGHGRTSMGRPSRFGYGSESISGITGRRGCAQGAPDASRCTRPRMPPTVWAPAIDCASSKHVSSGSPWMTKSIACEFRASCGRASVWDP